jgi:type II restriction enzyme
MSAAMSGKAYKKHLRNSSDLVSTYAQTRAGFVALALEKNRRATPFIEQARTLKALASQASSPAGLVNITDISPALIAAAGISDKAAGHLQQQDKLEAIQGLIRNFLEPAGDAFVEELVYRFLLTRGDSLGGSMRNLGGALAQRKFTRSIISTITLSNINFQWQHSVSKTWILSDGADADIELYLKGLCWTKSGKNRTLIYNLLVPLVDNKVDLCLFNCEPRSISVNNPSLYIAFGELKGGIDPAGADEHWKTARSALSRIKNSFASEQLSPYTFFIASAIEDKMAEEIWSQLEHGVLSNAANLSDNNQLTSISNWLFSL